MLTDRQLTGTFPIEVVILKESLEVLWLSNNPLSNINNGWEWLGELTQLSSLSLASTGFGYDEGLPSELGFLTRMENLELSRSQLQVP